MSRIVQNPFSRSDVKEKIKQTNLTRYGVSSPSQNPTVLSKIMRSRRHASVLTHWKTGKSLTCVGSYEVAFINWCNLHKIDFDWQIPHSMPDGRVYNVDAFIKTGEYANTWIEVKGWLSGVGKQKWEWFHAEHPNSSQLWNKSRLHVIGVL